MLAVAVKTCGYIMCHQFNMKDSYVLHRVKCIVYMHIRTNNSYFHITTLIDWFYNRNRECLLGGMNYTFKYNSE